MAFTINEFINLWFFETERAQKVLGHLSDQALLKKDPQGKTFFLDEILKLIQTPAKLLHPVGINIFQPTQEQLSIPTLRAKREIHLAVVRSVRENIVKRWGSSPLNLMVESGKKQTLEFLLLELLYRQAEIRIRLMQLMRESGISIPDLYHIPPELTI